MVREQLANLPGEVRLAMGRVPRHEFVPVETRDLAYADRPLPIGHGQTISQPYIVGCMTAELELGPSDRVLEIGTGSGYQAAILAELVAAVYTVEVVEPLARRAESVLRRLGYGNIFFRRGDGSLGWPEAAPFDAVIATCAPAQVPPKLFEQLQDGGRLVMPLGPLDGQELFLFQKQGGQISRRAICPVRFVPMTGEVQRAN